MAQINKAIRIEAPVEMVFAFMAEPGNLLEIWPGLLEVKDIQPLPNGGYAYRWTYKMAGMRFKGQATCTEYIKGRCIAYQNQSGIASRFIWTYMPEEQGTQLGVNIDYTIPGAAISRLAEPIILKMNEHEVDMLLANLKVRLEAGSNLYYSIGSRSVFP